jgi:hypothetical protein
MFCCRVACGVILVACAVPARAAGLPTHAEVNTGRVVDLATFARSVATRYHVAFRQMVAADIDRDGDVDVIAAGDHDVVVWLNDGAGHLTTQKPSRQSGIDEQSPGDRVRSRQRRAADWVPNAAPPLVVRSELSTQCPSRRSAARRIVDALAAQQLAASHAPRAPPAH